jgi:hypothetical protein
MTAEEMGITQVKELRENRADLQDILDIVAADEKYSNAKFLRTLQGKYCGLVVRLRQNRVLYQAPEQPKKRKRGRPRIHGKPFAIAKTAKQSDPVVCSTEPAADFAQFGPPARKPKTR